MPEKTRKPLRTISAPQTPYQSFLQRWEKGCGNGVCESARNICHVRGKIPCDIGFLGQAPGKVEDNNGFPFVGPAGLLLDNPSPARQGIVQQAGLTKYRLAFLNLVGCFPFDEEGKDREPGNDEVKKCKPRLMELIEILQPKLLVGVGRLATSWLNHEVHRFGNERKSKITAQVISIIHPSAILKASIMAQGLLVQQTVVKLANAAEEIFGGE